MQITNNKTKHLVLILTSLLIYMCPSAVAMCENSQWPIYAGGTTGSEDVRCFVYDPTNQLVIVGGITNSKKDFAPDEESIGYLFALDLEANWMWGNYFYN